jgi:predicted permease
MAPFKRFFRLPGSIQSEVNDEIAYHLEMKAEQLMREGWSAHKAREEAARRFGDERRVRQEVRELVADRTRRERRSSVLDELRQDVRFAVRQLVSAPLFALVAILTIGLGIGATAAIFSVVHAVLLRPLPYPDADRIVLIGEADDPGAKDARTTTSYPNYLDWQARARSFEAVGVFDGWSPTLTGLGSPERLQGSIVTAEIFTIFRLQPILGRPMLTTENVPNGPRVAWISESLWKTRLGGDPNVIGRTITLNGTEREIVGVLPSFEPPGQDLANDVWIPNYQDPQDGRGNRYLNVAARMRPGVTLAQARAEMADITAELQREYPDYMKGSYAIVFPLRALVVGGSTRGPVLLLMFAATLVLLIACANTSNLLIARGSYRAKEFAIRTALGTERWRLVRQLLTESLVLAGLGTALGLFLAAAGLQVLIALAPETIRAQEVGMDGIVLLFAVWIAFVAAIAFGILPALRATDGDVQQRLREEGRGSTSARSLRVRGALAVVQLSLALALLVGATLLLRSFARVLQVDPGIRGDNLITMAMALPSARYEGEAMPRFYEDVIARARATAGISDAAVVSTVPFSGGWDHVAVDTGATRNLPGTDLPEGDRNIVSPSYFRVVGIHLLAGREFTDGDRVDAPRVAVVDEVFARKVARNGSALGVRLGVPGSDSMATIIGVVNNVRHDGLDAESRGQIYVSHLQYPWRWMSVIARTHTDPAAQAALLRDVVHSVDPDQAVYDVRTMESLMNERSAPRRFVLALLGAFAAIALVLASVGLYGVVAYTIAQREREFGIRMALGASPPSLIRMVMSEGLTLAAIGIPLGLLLTFAGARFLRSLLFGVRPLDVGSAALATAVLGATALLATWVPARRAAKADPLQSMH